MNESSAKAKKAPSVRLRLSQEPENQPVTEESDVFSDFCDADDLDEIVSRAHKERQKRLNKQEQGKSFWVKLKLPRKVLENNQGISYSTPHASLSQKPTLTSQDKLSQINIVRNHIVCLDRILSDPSIPAELSSSLRELHGSLWLQVPTMDPYSLYQLLIQLQKQIARFRELKDIIKPSDASHTDSNPAIPMLNSATPQFDDPTSSPQMSGYFFQAMTALDRQNSTSRHVTKSSSAKRRTDPQQTTLFGHVKRQKPHTHENDDIMEEAIVLSLNDPLSGRRMKTPLRSRYCSHIECFELESFMQMNNLEPFPVSVRRKSTNKIDANEILSDTKRRPLNPDQHNRRTFEFQYKVQLRQNKDQNKPNNSLEFFTCPICKLEFSIRAPGDLYIVGELQAILEQLEISSTVDQIRISQDGSWSFVEAKKKEDAKESEIIELEDLDSSEEEREITKIKLERTAKKEASLISVQRFEDEAILDDLFEPSDREIEDEIDRIVDQVILKDGSRQSDYSSYLKTSALNAEKTQASEPVFFTGNGDEDDPFVID
ncbi:hypothetical protein KL918_000815 [Ogataea parapolymorpha]|nr:hypothetical protein KL918_000815 [Ogataea parapolymorpha]KAG7875678.1 hypothetical protein KL916_000349 [Ogataea parapolymorpha]